MLSITRLLPLDQNRWATWWTIGHLRTKTEFQTAFTQCQWNTLKLANKGAQGPGGNIVLSCSSSACLLATSDSKQSIVWFSIIFFQKDTAQWHSRPKMSWESEFGLWTVPESLVRGCLVRGGLPTVFGTIVTVRVGLISCPAFNCYPKSLRSAIPDWKWAQILNFLYELYQNLLSGLFRINDPDREMFFFQCCWGFDWFPVQHLADIVSMRWMLYRTENEPRIWNSFMNCPKISCQGCLVRGGLPTVLDVITFLSLCLVDFLSCINFRYRVCLKR